MVQTRKHKKRFTEFNMRIIARRIAMDLPIYPQYGGVRAQGIVSANGCNYNYIEDYTAGAYTIYAGRPRLKAESLLTQSDSNPDGLAECFLLFISEDKVAVLHSMRQSKDCAFQDNATSHNLLHAAMQLAKEKGATRIELTDVANKRLPYEKSFRLSTMYFLTTGRTWYETHGGFHPIAADEPDVSMWRHMALTNRWNKVFSCLKKQIPDIIIPVDISDIDGRAKGSAMEVFRRIKDARSSFFAEYQRALMICSKIGPLESITWYSDL